LVNSAEGTLLFYLPKEQHSEPKRKMTRREYNNYREDLRYTGLWQHHDDERQVK